MIFVAAAISIAAAAAVPQFTAALDQMRVVSAARYIAGRMAIARSQAVARSANVAVLFTDAPDHATLALYADGNGNGVRSRDIESAADPALGRSVDLETAFPRVRVFLNDSSNPATTTALWSFGPLGTASSGTVYLRGGDGAQYAVRVLGGTGRTRVLRYQATTGLWIEVF
jgi:Tfp pilus assembly protein FimT